MIVDAVGGSNFELLADLGDRRREAFFPNRLEEEIVDRLLPVGQRREHDAYILKIFSVVKARQTRVQEFRSPNELPRSKLRGIRMTRREFFPRRHPRMFL